MNTRNRPLFYGLPIWKATTMTTTPSTTRSRLDEAIRNAKFDLEAECTNANEAKIRIDEKRTHLSRLQDLLDAEPVAPQAPK